jgi:hypothetical protein
MRRAIKPCMQSAAQVVEKPIELLKPADFAAIYLNTNWYLILLEYINTRIDNVDDKATMHEIFEMQRVWMLQCYYRTTATKLFQGASNWFAPARRIQL